MNKFYKLKQLKSVTILSTDKAKAFKGGGGTGSGNGYPPPFGEEGTGMPPVNTGNPGGNGSSNGNNGGSGN